MKTTPPLEKLVWNAGLTAGGDMPLHARVRRALQAAIDEHFEDGQQFWTENALIERLGVSQVTVRRALLDLAGEGVLERKVAKGTIVRKAGAQAFDVGCFVPRYDSDFVHEMLEHLARACRAGGHRLNVYHTFQGETLAELWRQVEKAPRQERMVLMANPRETSQALYQALVDRGHPALVLEKPWAENIGLSVGVDNAQMMRLGLEHLKKLGHRRIALLVNEPRDHWSVQQREAAFTDGARELGLADVDVVDCGTHFGDDGHVTALEAMPALWGRRPTAIVAVSDSGAAAALQWFAQNGIGVPDQVSVLGVNNERLSRFTHPALSSLSLPFESMAEAALKLLTAPPSTPRDVRLPSVLVERRSTGAAPQTALPEERLAPGAGAPSRKLVAGAV